MLNGPYSYHRLTLALFMALYLFPTGIKAQRHDSFSGQTQDTLSILFTGDVLLDRSVRNVINRKGIRHLFSDVEEDFRKADAVVINLECPLTSTRTPLNKRYIFRAEAEWADSLYAAGVTHAAMANNHTNDQGRKGIEDTYQNLLRAGIVPLGYGRNEKERISPTIISKGEITVAIFNSVFVPLENWQPTDDGKADVCQTTAETLAQAIRLFKKDNPSTPVVAVVHWGVEFHTTPHISQRTAAKILVRAGADAIIGHHPHVVQAMGSIDSAPVFYSIGNFVFDHLAPEASKSMMPILKFTAGGLETTETIPVIIRQCRPEKRHEQR